MRKGFRSAVIIVLALVLSLLPWFGAQSAYAAEDENTTPGFENATPIEPDVPQSVVIDASEQYQYFVFTPDEDGTYRFYSYDNDGDPIAYLYDEDLNPIEDDDDSAGDRNYEIVYNCIAGSTYYLKSGLYSGTGTYTVIVKKEVPEVITPLEAGEKFYFEYGADSFTLKFTFTPNEGAAYDLNVSLPDGEYEVAYLVQTPVFSTNSSRNSVSDRAYDYDTGEHSDYFSCFWGEPMRAGVTYSITLEAVPVAGESGSGWVSIQESTNRPVTDMLLGEPVEMHDDLLCAFTAPESGYYTIAIDSGEGSTGDTDWGRVRAIYGEYAQSASVEFTANQQTQTEMFYLAAGQSVLTDVYYNGSDAILSGYITAQKVTDPFPEFQDAVPIEAGIPQEVVHDTDGQYKYFVFVPEEDGIYEFFSYDNDGDPNAFLYDETYSLIVQDDNSLDNGNYKIIYECTAGKTYYLKSGLYSGTGTYTVIVKKQEVPEIPDPREDALAVYDFDYGEDAFTLNYTFVPEESAAYDLYMCLPDGEYEVTWTLGTPYLTGTSGRNSVTNREHFDNAGYADYFNCIYREAMPAGTEYQITLEAEPVEGASGSGWVCIRKSTERPVTEMLPDEAVEMHDELLGLFTAPEAGYYNIAIDSGEGGSDNTVWGRVTVLYGVYGNNIMEEFYPNQQVQTEMFYLGAGQTALVDVYYNGSDAELSGYITAQKVADPLPDFQDAVPIEADTPQEVVIDTENYFTFFAFVPEEDGIYEFYSYDNNGDPKAYLYDESHLLLSEDNDSAGNGNYKILYECTAGETYYIKSGLFEGTGNYTVIVKKQVVPEVPDPREGALAVYDFDYGEDTFTLNYTFIPEENAAYDLYMCLPEGEYEVSCDLTTPGESFMASSKNSVINRVYFDTAGFADYFSIYSGPMIAGTEYQIALEAEPVEGASGSGWVCIRKNTERPVTDIQLDEPVEMHKDLLCLFTAPEAGYYNIAVDSGEPGPGYNIWGRVTVFSGEYAQKTSEEFEPNQQVQTENFYLAEGEPALISIYYTGSDEEMSGYITVNLDESVSPGTLKDISECSVTFNEPIYYTGSAIEPEFTVTDGDRELTAGAEYSAAYENNTNAGTATVIINGLRNYTGTAIHYFSIEPAPLNNAVITGIEDKMYTGQEVTQSPVVMIENVTLVPGTDYTLSYVYNVDPGMARMIINGKGNYIGERIRYFNIKCENPVLSSVSNVNGGVKVVWAAVNGAAKYRVFRKTGTGSWTELADTAAVNYTDTTAVSGTDYSYTVRCTNSAGGYISDYDTTGKAITYVAAPVISSISNVNGGVKIAWDAVNGSAKYRIFRKTGTGSWAKLADTAAVNYTDKTAVSGTDYSYTVRCLNSAGGYASAYNTTGKAITYVAAPVISSISNVNGGVKIAWSAVNGAAKYRVFRKTGTGSWAKLADTAAVNYTDKTAVSGTDYSYTVRCLNSAGSYASAYDTTGKAITYVAAPVISSISNVNGGVKIVWPKTAGAAKYRVFRKTGSGSWAKLADTTAVNYTDKTAANGTTYSYTIRCLNKSGGYAGAYNTTGKKITYVLMPTISSVTSPKAGQMLVKWNKNANATGYQIQYSLSSTFASGNKTVTVKDPATVSRTVTSLTAKKRYYVRVRTYKTVSGTNYYSTWSAAKNVVIK